MSGAKRGKSQLREAFVMVKEAGLEAEIIKGRHRHVKFVIKNTEGQTRLVTFSATPGAGQRGDKNQRADMRRAIAALSQSLKKEVSCE